MKACREHRQGKLLMSTNFISTFNRTEIEVIPCFAETSRKFNKNFPNKCCAFYQPEALTSKNQVSKQKAIFHRAKVYNVCKNKKQNYIQDFYLHSHSCPHQIKSDSIELRSMYFKIDELCKKIQY